MEAEGKMGLEVSGKSKRRRVVRRGSKYMGIQNGIRNWPRGTAVGGGPLPSETHEGVFLKVFLRAIADCYFHTKISFSPPLHYQNPYIVRVSLTWKEQVFFLVLLFSQA